MDTTTNTSNPGERKILYFDQVLPNYNLKENKRLEDRRKRYNLLPNFTFTTESADKPLVVTDETILKIIGSKYSHVITF